MKKTFTQEFYLLEQEAKRLFNLFDSLPDELFDRSRAQPSTMSLCKIKSFAKAYRSIVLLSHERDVILN